MTVRRRPGPARVVASVTAGLVLLTGATACETPEAANVPVPPVAVALNANVPDHLSIGVVMTLASAPGQGAEWRDAAEGTQVSAHRFALGGADVDLVPVNDKGTVAGAAAAVRTLTDRGVAGIVVATSGSHVSGALTEAVKGDVPMLLPYEDRADALPPQTWLTGPDRDSVDATLTQTLRGQNAGKLFLIRAGGAPITGLTPTASRTFRAGNDPAVLAKTVARRAGKRGRAVDAVAITGPAHLQADVVHALQGAGVDTPVFLTPEALSPAFPAELTQVGGSLSGQLFTAGIDDGDAGALAPSAAGRALAAYFSAVRQTAADPNEKDFFGDRPFSAVAGVAEVRSHDAVVALVRAAAAAGSADPAAVARALSGLKLNRADGLAGAALDFSSPTAVVGGAVVALTATPQSPGVRPTSGADRPALYWFPVPPN